MTQVGLILGTAAYMSPEQARGRVVDRRADIWAFGCVLYEMLTGAKTFGGDDVTDTIAAVVRAEPEWSKLPAATPQSIRRLLRRCLAKDVRARWLIWARRGWTSRTRMRLRWNRQRSRPPRPALCVAQSSTRLVGCRGLPDRACGARGVRAGPRRAGGRPCDSKSRCLRATCSLESTARPTLVECPGPIAVVRMDPESRFSRPETDAAVCGSERSAASSRARLPGQRASGRSVAGRWVGFCGRRNPEGRCGRRRAGSAVRGRLVRRRDLGQRQRHPLFVVARHPAGLGFRRRAEAGHDARRQRAGTCATDIRARLRTLRCAGAPSGAIHLGTPDSSEHSILLPGEPDSGFNISFSREHVLFLRGMR